MKRKIIAILVVLTMALSLAMPTMASNSQVVVDPQTRIWQDGFGFHCNNAKGNGATDVEYKGTNAAVIKAIEGIKKPVDKNKLMIVAKGDQKDYFGTKTYQITLERVGATTAWNLMTGTDIECKTCGRTDWVTYSNNSGVINGKNIQAHHPVIVPDEPGNLSSTISILKTVNGVPFSKWFNEIYLDALGIDPDEDPLGAMAALSALISGMSFRLFAEDETPIANGAIDGFTGEITFTINENTPAGFVNKTYNAEKDVYEYMLKSGDYYIVETLSGVALSVFNNEDGKVRLDITVENGSIVGGGVSKFPGVAPFVIDRTTGVHAVKNFSRTEDGAIDWYAPYELDTIYNFNAKDAEDIVYASLCAGKISASLGDVYEDKTDEWELNSDKQAQIVSAINYIIDKYGEIEFNEYVFTQNKLIAQIVVWQIIGDVDNIVAGYYAEDTGWFIENTQVTALVADVMENGLEFAGAYKVAFLAVEGYPENVADNQPQIVWYKGGGTFDNKTGGHFSSTVSFDKTKYGGLLDVFANEFAFDLYKLVNGEWVLVTASDYIETDFGSRFYTVLGGKVTVNGLKPGSYKFVELRSVVANTGDPLDNYGYKHVWTVGELYFTIDSKGDVSWYDKDGETVPNVIDNEIVCKGALQFLSLDNIINGLGTTLEWVASQPEFVAYAYDTDGGIIGVYSTFGCQGGVYKGEQEPATCGRDAILAVSCGCHEGHGARIPVPGTALAHDWQPMGEWYGNGDWEFCALCGAIDDKGYYDAPNPPVVCPDCNEDPCVCNDPVVCPDCNSDPCTCGDPVACPDCEEDPCTCDATPVCPDCGEPMIDWSGEGDWLCFDCM